jgi:hypothetical protein
VRPVVVLLLLCGCLTERNYPQRVASDLCERYDTCNPVELAQVYGSTGACEDDQERSLEIFLAAGEGQQCLWDHDRAQECLSGIEDVSCEDFSVGALLDLCARAWGCPD